MHSFRHSRSRILFEVLCALAISASFAGAWTQTGAWALLPAAAVAALYALVHAFDLAGRGTAEVAEPQRIDFAPDRRADPLIEPAAVAPVAADVPQPTIDRAIEVIEQAEPREPAAPSAKAGRRPKAPRKGGRRASVPKEGKVVELAPLAEAEIASIHSEAVEEDMSVNSEEVTHPHIAALFEPEPFARMPRRAFGRKAG